MLVFSAAPVKWSEIERHGLLTEYVHNRPSVAFMLGDAPHEPPNPDLVRVRSVPASRPYDDGVRRKHDFPASAQLEVNTARMENEGMPATGWPVNVRDLSCTCRLYQKFFACIHVLFALNLRGHIDRFDRERLVSVAQHNAPAQRPWTLSSK
ncbi:hypothetical protein PI125_g16003 [Phytophthora idaei]|nr:hypothetical protein PI125_g16003 [Phytophthora idaei]